MRCLAAVLMTAWAASACPRTEPADPTDAAHEVAEPDLPRDAGAPDVPPVIPEGPQVPVTIDPTQADGHLDPRYLGVAFDTAQLTGAMWWVAGSEERQPVAMPDLSSPRLRALVSQLAPLIIRVGGTDCDAVWFCDDTAGPCELPHAWRDTFRSDERLETVLTGSRVAEVGDFAAAVGGEVLFCINVGPGPRDPVSGDWQPDNARELMRFAKGLDSGHVFTLWEPGNEVNTAIVTFRLPLGLDAVRFANDLETFRALVDAESEGAKVVAPGSYVSPYGELADFTPALMSELAARGRMPLDGVSWHLYATQSTSSPMQIDPATVENLFSEELNEQHRGWAHAMREAAGDLPVWNTESASAQSGGQAGLSDVLADALWYGDWYGIMAEEGTRLIIRHSLVGADYSLLEPDSFDPRPTFAGLVMLRRTVTGAHLSTYVDRTRLKAHGWCAPPGKGSLTVVLANASSQGLVARIALTQGAIASAEQWTLEAAGDLASKDATLNGAPAYAPGGVIAEPSGEAVTVVAGEAYAALPPASLGFVVLSGDAAEACQSTAP